MDAVRVSLLREVLAGTEWLQATRRFAASLRTAVRAGGGGGGGNLLLVGCEGYEPWHLAAHLDDEAAWSGTPELSPTLVRHRVPDAAPAHLSVGLGRLETAGRRETLLVVSPEPPGNGLLERVHDARRAGAAILALESRESPGPAGRTAALHGMAHDVLTTDRDGLDLDTIQHLVSAAAGEQEPPTPRPRRRFADRLSRAAEQLIDPPPSARW